MWIRLKAAFYCLLGRGVCYRVHITGHLSVKDRAFIASNTFSGKF